MSPREDKGQRYKTRRGAFSVVSAIGVLIALTALVSMWLGAPLLTKDWITFKTNHNVRLLDGSIILARKMRRAIWTTPSYSDGPRGYRSYYPGPVWVELANGERRWLRGLEVRGRYTRRWSSFTEK